MELQVVSNRNWFWLSFLYMGSTYHRAVHTLFANQIHTALPLGSQHWCFYYHAHTENQEAVTNFVHLGAIQLPVAKFLFLSSLQEADSLVLVSIE